MGRKMLYALAVSTLLWTFWVLTREEVYHNRVVYVKAGDTVFGIASENTAPREDVWEVVERIAKANRLGNSVLIHPGDKLIVPVKGN